MSVALGCGAVRRGHRAYPNRNGCEEWETDMHEFQDQHNEAPSVPEHSDRAKYVTHIVSVWIANDGEFIDVARLRLVESVEAMAMYLEWVIRHCIGGKAEQVNRELAQNDYGRIHWDDVAEAIKENEEGEQ